MLKAGGKVGENDEYTLIKFLGKGTYGVVWQAEKRIRYADKGRNYALKFLFDDTSEEVDFAKFKREVNAWIDASGHSNVIDIHDAFSDKGRFVIVSDFAEGGSLGDWLKYFRQTSSFEQAIEMMRGILNGLIHLHSQTPKIVHCDLKPENVLLKSKVPHLIDFGLSRIVEDSLRKTTHTLGSWFYISPDAIKGEISPKVDIWSAGVIFYEMLCGYNPFYDDKIAGLQTDTSQKFALAQAISLNEPKPLPSNVPKELQDIIFKALQKNPKQRFTTEEMYKSLDDAFYELRFKAARLKETIVDSSWQDTKTKEPQRTSSLLKETKPRIENEEKTRIEENKKLQEKRQNEALRQNELEKARRLQEAEEKHKQEELALKEKEDIERQQKEIEKRKFDELEKIRLQKLAEDERKKLETEKEERLEAERQKKSLAVQLQKEKAKKEKIQRVEEQKKKEELKRRQKQQRWETIKSLILLPINLPWILVLELIDNTKDDWKHRDYSSIFFLRICGTLLLIGGLLFLGFVAFIQIVTWNDTSVKFFRDGESCFKEKNYDCAISNFSEVVKSKPESTYAYFYRGISYNNINEFDKAIVDYSKTIELEPQDAPTIASAYINRGNAYWNQKNYEKALNDYGKFIELRPADAVGYFNRGLVYNINREYNKAITDFNKAVELDPNKANYYRSRAAALENIKNLVQAQSDRKKADELEGKK